MTTVEELTERSFNEEIPWSMKFRVKGTRPFLFSRPPDELKAARGKAHVPNKQELEEKVWRVEDGLGYAAAQIISQLRWAAQQEPNPAPMGKGSAMKQVREGFTCDPDPVVPFLVGDKPVLEWDAVQKHWVGATKGGYTWRPLLETGWEMEFILSCARPRWFSPSKLIELVTVLGLLGIGDGKVLGYGRFQILQAQPPQNIRWVN